MNNNIYCLFLLLSNFIAAVSQMLLKKSAMENHKSIIYEYLNWKVILAYAMFFGAVFADMYALKFVSISFVPVLETSSYVFILIFSRLFFRERISLKQFIGISVIITGILIFVIP